MQARALASPGRLARGLAWALLAGALAWATPAPAQLPPTEPALKAAYLYRFLAYVDWPAAAVPQPDTPLVIGVVEAPPVQAALATMSSGRPVDGRPVVVKPLGPNDPLDGLHAVFISRAAPVSKVIDRLNGRPVLVVTESGLEPGSMLNFVLSDGRVRFEAAPATAERAGIKLGARLLGVAERLAP
jgi:hypothetical protein